MDNLSTPRNQELDDLLAEFTDQVLSSENEAKVLETTDQNELDELKKTVLRMKAAVQTARTTDTTNVRIRARLLEEWNKTTQAERQAPKRFVWNWSLRGIALAGGFAILIIFSAISLIAPLAPSLVGTADGLRPWSPLFILSGIIIIVLLLWHNRHN